jgi:hypothetical protein
MDLDPFAAKSFKLHSFSLSIRWRPGSVLGKNEPYNSPSAPFSSLYYFVGAGIAQLV